MIPSIYIPLACACAIITQNSMVSRHSHSIFVQPPVSVRGRVGSFLQATSWLFRQAVLEAGKMATTQEAWFAYYGS